MNLKSLLLCADEKIVRVLRRTLGDLEIEVELCASPETALRKLTRERFEAIIVDCAGPGAADVLRFARTSPCNKRTVAVAILAPDSGMRSAFEIGANFVLYKPVSVERAKSSFRAARALMKKERRRNSRVEVRFPVEMSSRESGARFKVNTTDIGEGGLAISLPKRSKPHGRWALSFTLPGSSSVLEVDAEFAWEGTGTQVGLRFQDQTPEFGRQLREWLGRNSPDAERDDPPARCQLTDLSLGGCYLDIASPFPVSTRVTLSMRAAGVELRAEGIVRVMHPDKGMGVEFSQRTAEHRALLEKFLNLLTEHRDVLPELMVEPEGLETESANTSSERAIGELEDALLGLFRNQAALPTDSFLAELRKQRGMAAASGASA
ncbi:MAG TPA: PilZ domain-containing protein [Candidatus Acidoferrum sp.]|jgi:CheY-like chemotaxis protein|nr:PilZ domain-containing protein [Candidatus Acidoferrum sp.]